MAPPVKEATKLLSAYTKNVAESCREFVRWMDGTCMEMPDQRPKGETDGDPLILHFSSEVLRMQQVSHDTSLSEHLAVSTDSCILIILCSCGHCNGHISDAATAV